MNKIEETWDANEWQGREYKQVQSSLMGCFWTCFLCATFIIAGAILSIFI